MTTDDDDLDTIAEHLAERMTGMIKKDLLVWAVRTALGLGIAGLVWWMKAWGIWLFFAYAVIALGSLIVIYWKYNMILTHMTAKAAATADDGSYEVDANNTDDETTTD